MDYPRWYERISAPFRSSRAATLLIGADKALAALVAAGYAGALAWLVANDDGRLWRAIAVPALTLTLVTALRRAINRPRPYEEHALDPIIAKGTRGASLPSRHVASAVIIACTVIWIAPRLAPLAVLVCAAIAAIRVVGGVHYPKDILAAAAIALACAAVGFLVLP